MDIRKDPRIDEFIEKLSADNKGRILKQLDFFNKYGFQLPNKYLKKLDSNLWELRPGNIRLLLGKIKEKEMIVIVYGFKKKTQKTPKQYIDTAKSRLKEYEI